MQFQPSANYPQYSSFETTINFANSKLIKKTTQSISAFQRNLKDQFADFKEKDKIPKFDDITQSQAQTNYLFHRLWNASSFRT